MPTRHRQTAEGNVTGRNLLAVLAAVMATGAAAACGSSAEKPKSLAEAKATLSKDCQQGKAADKPLCDCIGDKLSAAGNDAEKILALDKEVNGGKTPAAVSKAATQCAASAAK